MILSSDTVAEGKKNLSQFTPATLGSFLTLFKKKTKTK